MTEGLDTMTEKKKNAPAAEVERHRGPHDVPAPRMTFPERIEYANRLAAASLLPAQYRQAPANVLVAMEFGDALGIPPIQAINSIHVIEGKPTASADLLAALIRRAGHTLRVSGDDTTATAQIIRWDDPEFVAESVWTLEKARRAGLVDKKGGNWNRYPGAMLRARAITEVARAAASDALFGVRYTPEELGAEVNEEGTPLEYVSREVPAPAPAPTPQPATAPQAAPQASEAPAPAPAVNEPETAAQAAQADVVDVTPEDAPESAQDAALRLAAAGDPQGAVRAAWGDPGALYALDAWIAEHRPEAVPFRELIAARLESLKGGQA